MNDAPLLGETLPKGDLPHTHLTDRKQIALCENLTLPQTFWSLMQKSYRVPAYAESSWGATSEQGAEPGRPSPRPTSSTISSRAVSL